MSYLLKVTAGGAAKVAAAQVGGPVVSLTHIAVGDGNGSAVSAPDGTETELVREVYRDQIAALYVNPADDTVFRVEMTIPSDEGDWAVREIGVFDVDGDLFAYGNFPETWKPIAEDGATREMVILGAIRVATTSVIELVIDDTIVLASRAWVLANITKASLIPGGLTGMLLMKTSNADGAYDWVDVTEGIQVLVDIIQETQTLIADQDVVNFSTVGTEGLAVYIEGSRLVLDVHYTVTGPSQITLAEPYPADTLLHAYQNDPLEAPAYMRPALNLSDLTDKTAARANLGVAGRAKMYFMGQI